MPLAVRASLLARLREQPAASDVRRNWRRYELCDLNP